MLLSFITVFVVFWLTYAITILSLTGEPIAPSKILWKIFENGAFEIFADMRDEMKIGKIASCDENSIKTSEQAVDCLIRSWLIPISLLVYVLVCTIVLINLITSFLTSAYDELKSDSCPQSEVHYEFYRRLQEYRMKPLLPPPLIIFSILAAVCCYCCSSKTPADGSRNGSYHVKPNGVDLEPTFISIPIINTSTGDAEALLQKETPGSSSAYPNASHCSIILS